MEGALLSNLFNFSTTTQSDAGENDVPLESIPLYNITNYLWYVCSPVIIVLGIFGNVMTIVIMQRMTSGESTVNMYFTSIAVTDLLVLVSASFKEWLNLTFGYHLQDIHTISCKIFVWISTCSGTISCWFLVCLTSHRAMSVVWPHRVSSLCTRRTVIVVITGIAVFFAILYSHYLFGFDLVYSNNGTSPSCVMESGDYKQFVEDIFAYIELAVYSLLPFVCLVLANGVLVWKLTASVKAVRKTLTGSGSEQIVAREKAANSVTLTVVVVSFAFICLTLPTSVNYTLYYFAREYNEVTGYEYAKVHLFYTVSYLLADCNSAVNFYLYCLTGRRFREEFIKLICCGRLIKGCDGTSVLKQSSDRPAGDTRPRPSVGNGIQ